jgi:protein-tyrosine phosphatase
MDTNKSSIKDSYLVVITSTIIEKIKNESLPLSAFFRNSVSEDFFTKISDAIEIIILIKTEISQSKIEFMQEKIIKDVPYVIHVYNEYIKNVPEEYIVKSKQFNIQMPPKRQFIDYYSRALNESSKFEPDEIIPGLFLGGVNCTDEKILQKYNIQCVLSVMSNPPNIDETNIEHMKVYILDNSSENISQHFDIAHIFISQSLKEKKNILVHCHAGISRSATIIISYIMKSQMLTLNDAYKFVKDKRSIVEPNFGFYFCLAKFEKDLAVEK